MEAFDLITYQNKARELLCPKQLFYLWEEICRKYEHHEIGIYELEEMKAVIWPALSALSSLKRIIDSQPVARKQKSTRRA